MTWSWFDLAWCWIGLAAAALLLLLLFATQRLRGDRRLSRWRDPVWLSWLAVPAYMIHQTEEYGIDLLGRLHAFPDALCEELGLGAYPGCPVPPAFYPSVNVSAIWFVGTLCAFMSRQHPLVGLSLYGLILSNGLVHVVPFLAGGGYSPGTLTAALIFLPLSGWAARACFGGSGLGAAGLAAVLASGILVHLVLMGSLLLFIGGGLSRPVLIAIQLLNPLLLVLVPRMGERLARPAPAG